MEVELVRSKNDMMSLNNQLLEAIQRKLELSQELEAWQVGSTFLSNGFCSSNPVHISLQLPKSSLMLSLLSHCFQIFLHIPCFMKYLNNIFDLQF